MKNRIFAKSISEMKTKMALSLMMGLLLSQSAYASENTSSSKMPDARAVGIYVESNLYFSLLGREPDEAGLNFWTSNAIAGRVSCAQLAATFIMTPQFQARTAVTNEVHIHVLYYALLGRTAEDSAVTNFLRDVKRGSMTRQDLARSILRSAEFDVRCRSNYGFPDGAGTFSGL